MARVFGIHEVMLRPGLGEAEFERLVAEELPSLPHALGTRVCVLKGDRGDRAGRYLVAYEFESVQLRERYWPGGLMSD